MDEIWKIIILAVVQGITEFLPISSSGHLVILKYLFNLNHTGATLEIVLHAGTLVSIIIFYRLRIIEILTNIINKDKNSIFYVGLIFISLIPAGVLGWFFGDHIVKIFDRPHLVAILLIITGIFLLISHFSKPLFLSLGRFTAFLIGIAQMIALLPGISRSGATIGTARLLGINTNKAAEFSFLMSIPLLMGVIVYKSLSFYKEEIIDYEIFSLFLGFLVSFLIGYFALTWLVSLLNKGKFWYFGFYCIIVGSFYVAFISFL